MIIDTHIVINFNSAIVPFCNVLVYRWYKLDYGHGWKQTNFHAPTFELIQLNANQLFIISSCSFCRISLSYNVRVWSPMPCCKLNTNSVSAPQYGWGNCGGYGLWCHLKIYIYIFRDNSSLLAFFFVLFFLPVCIAVTSFVCASDILLKQ